MEAQQLTLTVGTVSLAALALIVFLKRRKTTPFLDKTWKTMKLTHKLEITKGVPCPVTKFRFQLESKSQILGLPIGQHLALRCNHPETGKPCMRSYTPVTSDDERGYVDLVIKIYEKGVMGQHLNHLQVGQSIEVLGPKGLFTYVKSRYSTIAMLAGGSGITPMYQILCQGMKMADDTTKFCLIYGNVTEQDIILKEELDEMAAKFSRRVSIYHVLNNPSPDWKQGSGFVSQEHVANNFPPPDTRGIKVLLCGPPPMNNAMQKLLGDMKYQQQDIFTF
jgi:cytochrome-b5 reductase